MRKRIRLGHFKYTPKEKDENCHPDIWKCKLEVWLEKADWYDEIHYQVYFTDLFVYPIALGIILANLPTFPVSMYGRTQRHAYTKYRICFQNPLLGDYESIAQAVETLKSFRAESKFGRIEFIPDKDMEAKIQKLFLSDNL